MMQTLENQLSIKPPDPISKDWQISKQKLEIFKQKLALLAQNLETFPFIPGTRSLISISTHEKLFRDLNLWDFANLKLDVEIKKGLLNEFIAYYDPIKRFSYVQGLKISLSHADLSKALSLPSKNHTIENSKFSANEFGGVDKVYDILWECILNKMVIVGDAAILPEEVANANSLVKAGSPNNVDWAGLIWTLIEKEILDAPNSGRCYYASHLQRLMKFQKPGLFEEAESSNQSEAAVDEDDCILEEVDGGSGDDKCSTMLSVGINVDSEAGKKEEDAKFESSDNFDMDVSQCDDKKERDACLNNIEDNMVDNLCAEEEDNNEKVEDISEDGPVDVSTLIKGHVDVGKTVDGVTNVELGGFYERKDGEASENCNGMNFELGSLNPKDEIWANVVNHVMESEMGRLNVGNDGMAINNDVGERNFDGLNSSGFDEVIETNNNPSLNIDFFPMGRSDVHDTIMNLEVGQSESLYFGNEHKRCFSETNHFAEGFQHKRLRSDQPWNKTPTVTGFDQLSEEIQLVMGKMKMDILEKEHDFSNVIMQIKLVKEMVQQKDDIIRSVEISRMEAMRKRQLEACKYEHDLKHLRNMVLGCKKALNDTQTRFDAYRIKYPVGGKKCNNKLDVEGSKQCLEKEKETRRIIHSMITDCCKMWLEKVENSGKLISKYSAKLATFKEQVDALKELVAKAKNQALD